MFEFYATKSCLFLLKAMYVMGNLSDIMDLLILWRLDALFGCGRANSESMRGLASASLLPSPLFIQCVSHTIAWISETRFNWP